MYRINYKDVNTVKNLLYSYSLINELTKADNTLLGYTNNFKAEDLLVLKLDIDNAFSKLKDRDKRILKDYYIKNNTIKYIAEKYNITQSLAKKELTINVNADNTAFARFYYALNDIGGDTNKCVNKG